MTQHSMGRWLRCGWLAWLAAACTGLASAGDWPGWRGPRGDGTSLETDVPVQWNGPANQNIAWKTALSGSGHSSPVVFAEKIFLTACREQTGERVLLCLDRRSGRTLWQQTVVRAPLEQKHFLNSYASGTPAVDADRVYVALLEPDGRDEPDEKHPDHKLRSPGNMVVAAYDHQGQQKWLVRAGRFASIHGFCTSPILYKDLVILNGDHDGPSYLIALARASGRTQWRIDRPNGLRSYCTPLVRHLAGRDQLVLSGSRCVASYDPNTGSLGWIIDGPTEQFVASPVTDGRLLLITAGYPDRHILAIRPDGQGNVTDSHVVWRTQRGCAYVPSPIAAGEYFLVPADNGVASCLEAKTGRVAWSRRLGIGFSTSPISAASLVYFVDDAGVTRVVRPGNKFELMAENPLGEECRASPAISQGQIFLRGVKHLWCIGKKDAQP